MSKKDPHKEKLNLEELFQETFNEHREAVEEKDFNDFMGQLEDSGYFDKPDRRPFYYGLGGALLLLIGLAVFLFPAAEKEGKNPMDSIENPVQEREEETLEEDKTERVQEEAEQKGSLMKRTLIREGKKKTEEKTDKIIKENSKPDAKTSPEEGAPKPDTLVNTPVKSKKEEVKTKLPANDSVRVHIVMEVDTIIKIDSQSINRRKWEKLKNKGK